MLENFTGRGEREYAVKLLPDNTEIPFYFEYQEDPNMQQAYFLSNLSMVGTKIAIITGANLDWKPKDIVLLGHEKTRYQVEEIQLMKRNLPKNFMKLKPKFYYILYIGA